MVAKRKVEVFSASCPACASTVALVQRLACPSCEVSVLDMQDPAVARRAEGLGIHRIPAIVVDGRVAGCCSEKGPDEASLRLMGLGKNLD